MLVQMLADFPAPIDVPAIGRHPILLPVGQVHGPLIDQVDGMGHGEIIFIVPWVLLVFRAVAEILRDRVVLHIATHALAEKGGRKLELIEHQSDENAGKTGSPVVNIGLRVSHPGRIIDQQ